MNGSNNYKMNDTFDVLGCWRNILSLLPENDPLAEEVSEQIELAEECFGDPDATADMADPGAEANKGAASVADDAKLRTYIDKSKDILDRIKERYSGDPEHGMLEKQVDAVREQTDHILERAEHHNSGEKGTEDKEINAAEEPKADAEEKSEKDQSISDEVDNKLKGIKNDAEAKVASENGCPENASEEERRSFFDKQKAALGEYASRMIAVKMVDKYLHTANESGTLDKHLKEQMLGTDNIVSSAAEVRNGPDFTHMMSKVNSWEDLNKLKSLVVNDNGGGLMNELYKNSREIIKEDAQAERMKQAKREAVLNAAVKDPMAGRHM